MLVTNTTRQQLFSTMKHNKNFPRNIATGNRLNHCIMLHVHYEKTI